MARGSRPALLLGETLPHQGRKNTIWSWLAGFCLLLCVGGIINLVRKLSAAEYSEVFSVVIFAWVSAWSALICAAQTTWGSARVQRVLSREQTDGLRLPDDDAR